MKLERLSSYLIVFLGQLPAAEAVANGGCEGVHRHRGPLQFGACHLEDAVVDLVGERFLLGGRVVLTGDGVDLGNQTRREDGGEQLRDIESVVERDFEEPAKRA